MIKQLQLFLGPARLRALVLLLGITGLLSLALNAFAGDSDWARTVQTALVIVFLLGATWVIGGRMQREERLRWTAILAPAVGAIILGQTVLPQFALPLLGAAAGWIVAGAFLFRPRIPKEYQDAIRALRKGEYAQSVEAMSTLIEAEPENEQYYRFRAEVLRLWGRLKQAREDYETMARLAPDSAVAYNGLAEVLLQSGKFAEAHQAALKAYELAPDEWVAAYNLGMIEDRLREAQPAVEHLQQALALKVPDVRHRLLIYLYLARAYQRLGNAQAAQEAVENLRRYKSGLEEWQHILEYEQAAALRAVLAADIETAQELVSGNADAETLV